jgi:hypothetical protein
VHHIFPAKTLHFVVDPRAVKSPTSAVQRMIEARI